MVETNNVDLQKVWKGLEEADRVLLTSHIRSDADAIGSELGLLYLLERMGAEVEIANHGGVSEHCQWLPRAHEIMSGPDDLSGSYDTLVSVDCANRDRLGNITEAIATDTTVINIDHHETNERFGEINWIDPERSSVGEMIYEIWLHSSFEIDVDPATCIYAALVSDTGQFAFPQTSARSHEIAAGLLDAGVVPYKVTRKLFQDYSRSELDLMARVIRNIEQTDDKRIAWSVLDSKAYEECGTEPWDSQPYVQLVMQLEDVEIGLLLRRLVDPDVSGTYQGYIKGSLRSRGTYDVGALAGLFGGGGHPQAAGFVIEKTDPIDQVERSVISRLQEEIKEEHVYC